MNPHRTLASLALVALAFACLPAAGEVLVRQCEQPSATECSRAVWVRPASATTVQVLRGTTAPWAALVDVLATERIQVCVDDPAILVGQPGACATRVPDRNDNWQLKSIVYAPVPAGSLLLTVDATNPRWDSNEPLSTNLLANLFVRIYAGEQGAPKVLIDAAPWAASLRFRRESPSTAIHCFSAALGLDTTGDGLPDLESPQTTESCGTYGQPIRLLLPPNGITVQSPAP